MLHTKFKCLIHGEPLKNATVFSTDDLKINPLFSKFDELLQFANFQDFNKTDVYDGDILQLKITPELMDHTKNAFYNSNLGRYIKQEKNITDVYLVINGPEHNKLFLYELYMARDHKLERDDDDKPEYNCIGEDSSFPMYLVQKGATIIGNLYETPNFMDNL